MQPVKIYLENDKLKINWDDGSERAIKLSNLRNHCPCAVCENLREERGQDFIPLFNEDQVSINKIEVSGNYALKFIWNDGHDTGIYEYEYLKKFES